MNNNLLQLKVKERLNKLSSNDYDNIECWQIAEAFNKAQLEWVRRQLHGNNLYKEGDEQSKRRIDDLQVLLTSAPLQCTMTQQYFQSGAIPQDYLEFKRVSIQGKNDECGLRPFVVYQAEEADVDVLMRDPNTRPSFEWAETFCTLIDNRIRIYTNGAFTIDKNPSLTYYRQPKPVQFKNCSNPETGELFTVDQISEFKDDIVELIIDEACAILAGDIESISQFQRGTQQAERNN